MRTPIIAAATFALAAASLVSVPPAALAASTATFSGDVQSSDAPGAPTGVSATAGPGTATVTWTAPVVTGESPLVYYIVNSSSNGGQSWAVWTQVPASQTTYAGYLTGGMTYVFQVIAVNDAGTGPPSTNSNPVAVTSRPNPPTNVQGTPGFISVAVSWTAPSQTGGEPVTSYIVRYSTDGGGSWTQFPDIVWKATSVTIGNLKSQAGYIFEVAAVNKVGTSPWSTASSLIYPAIDPNAPTDVVGTSGYQSVELTWLPPPNGTAPVTGYNVRYSDDSGATWSKFVATGSSATTYTYDNLTQPIVLIFEVQAVNAVGVSAWSAPSAPVMAETRSSPPTKLRAHASDAQATLTWDPPADLGGGTLTGYRIDIREAGSSQWRIHTASTGTGATRYTVTDLANGTSYEFRIAAITTTFGLGLFSQTAFVTPFAASDRPSDVRATAGNATATITWVAPADDHGRRVVGYRIEAATSTGWYLIEADTKSTATSFVASGLVNGQTYLFRVAAINAAGVGEESVPSNAVTPTAASPGPPRWVSVRPGAGRAEVAWQPPLQPGASPVTGYVVEVSVAGGPWATQCETASLACLIDGLSTTQPYRFRVSATSAVGAGAWSSPTRAITPSIAPQRPVITGVTVSGHNAIIHMTSGSLGRVHLERWNTDGYWQRIKGATLTLPKDATEARIRAIHRGDMSPEVRVTVTRPQRAKAQVALTIDGDRSKITSSTKAGLHWRYGTAGEWKAVTSPLTLRTPEPPKAWSLQVLARSGTVRELVSVQIR